MYRSCRSINGFVLGAVTALIFDKTVIRFVAKALVRSALTVKENVAALHAEIKEDIQDERAAREVRSNQGGNPVAPVS